MQLPREKPGEALAPAVGVRAGLGAGMYLSQLLPSGEFRESPGWAAAAAVAWPGTQEVGKHRSVPGRGEGRRRLPEPGRGSAGRESGVRGAPAARELHRQPEQPHRGEGGRDT